ncbi:MAG: DUF5662 family protein [Erysipelotrichaceae bacterium]
MKLLQHFMTITTHKWEVAKLMFRVGLYRQGLSHDLSKYSWIEFSSGVRYFQGYRSPIDAEREAKGVSLGWLHHKGRNRHHWEYWMDNGRGGLRPVRMPTCFLVEMFCDRVAASKIYKKEHYHDGSALEYFLAGKKYTQLHPESEELLESLLRMLASDGESKTLRFIKEQIIKQHSI